ncbi:uncharacterized protein [Primulina huaijiensis]|uniref:uncharacterized protein n=1 Tax=Primulina huaijiensis TaxID=1492673 RepID=UPI003CC707D7
MEASGGGAVPTGCYKCGRPGHWSRDCPSNPDPADPFVPNSNSNSNSNSDPNSSLHRLRPSAAAQKPQRAPRTRPKLTPDLLLSDAGIGHVLRRFPRAVKCRGRGYEVDDLGHLLGLYAEWHSRLLPYYSFDQFMHKVEQVGATKSVKFCLRDLRERVADGVDPAKLHESELVKDSSNEQDAQGDVDETTILKENSLQNKNTNNCQDIPDCTWENATEEASHSLQVEDATADVLANQRPDSSAANSNPRQIISEEQRVRVEANKLKALERAAARGHSSRPLCGSAFQS